MNKKPTIASIRLEPDSGLIKSIIIQVVVCQPFNPKGFQAELNSYSELLFKGKTKITLIEML